MLADLVFGGDGFGAGAGVGLAEQDGAGEQEAAGQPGGFFFLFGVAGDERVAGELLDFPDIVIEQDVGEFVAYVARIVTIVSRYSGACQGCVATVRRLSSLPADTAAMTREAGPGMAAPRECLPCWGAFSTRAWLARSRHQGA